jgi:hypothetical protein
MERSEAAWTHMIELFAAHRPLWAVGSLYLALLAGVMAQWLIDPKHAPSGRDLAEALRTITADITSGNHSNKVGSAPDVISDLRLRPASRARRQVQKKSDEATRG